MSYSQIYETQKVIQSLPNFYKDRFTNQLMVNADLWDTASDYLEYPFGYAETDNMSREQALNELDEWFRMAKCTKQDSKKEYADFMNRLFIRITTAWLENRQAKDIGRTIARLHYLINAKS